MAVGLIIVGIILLILGFLTPIGSGTTILVSLVLFIIAIVRLYKERKE